MLISCSLPISALKLVGPCALIAIIAGTYYNYFHALVIALAGYATSYKIFSPFFTAFVTNIFEMFGCCLIRPPAILLGMFITMGCAKITLDGLFDPPPQQNQNQDAVNNDQAV